MKHLNSIKYSDHRDISITDTRIISNGIIEENTRNQHMIERSPDELLYFAKQHGWIVARDNDWRLAGFITFSLLDKGMNLYERGSLLVLPEYRDRWIAKTLIRSITERYKELAILSVTNVPGIIRINSWHSEQIELLRKNTPRRLMKIIEWPQPLSASDKVFINRTLWERVANGEFGAVLPEQWNVAQFGNHLLFGT